MLDIIKQIKKRGKISETRLTDLKDFLNNKSDKLAAEKILKTKNPLIYSVKYLGEDEISYAITSINYGKIGFQPYMTKGHYHVKLTPEVYYLISGKGYLLLEKGKDKQKVIMKPGVFHYIPAGYAHRAVNSGKKKFVFLSIYQTDSGHDYARILKEGF